MLKLEDSPLLDQELSITDPLGSGGESLELFVRDCLNEVGLRCHRAALDEDLLEATDLRVHVDGVDRSKGIRMQVSWIADYHSFKRKRFLIPFASTVVFVAPFTLAQFAAGRTSFGSDYDNAQIAMDERSAMQLRESISDVINGDRHPFGPSRTATQKLKDQIVDYVRLDAPRCHALLRKRQAIRPAYGSFGADIRTRVIQEMEERRLARIARNNEGNRDS
ncbi:MAG: hypothetical protein ACAH95_01725 [Fimbriimonas sp.]